MNNLIIKFGPIAALFIAWFYTYYQGILTAVNIWGNSEIFNHCFFVIPIAFYLIYQKRHELSRQPFVANYWLLLPIIGTLVLYTFGSVGDIRLFMHVATFVSLPLLIWFVIGNKAAQVIAFPLFFILFSIPVGEQLIPFLQEITTDMAVPLLELTGIPVYRNGLYLEIPEGRFLVAEACSGISFLITSIVFGHLYAYISFKTLPKKLLFILISLIFPILANALRVYGIVLIAHLTDMEHAAGADHLIYGGVFFAIVLFSLIMIGEKMRDKFDADKSGKETSNATVAVDEKALVVSNKLVMFSIFLFVTQIFWYSAIVNEQSSLTNNELIVDIKTLPLVVKEQNLQRWQPEFSTASNIQQGIIIGPYAVGSEYSASQQVENIDFFIASYQGGEGELISAANKLYNEQRWTLIQNRSVNIDEGSEARLIKIVSPIGQYRYILYWYQLPDKAFTNKVKLKLYQTWMAMFGQTEQSAIIALSFESEQNIEAVINSLSAKASIIQNSIKD
ncbi:exosortase A [Colwellia echini]|uniref:EpsI family protein n=1 Tax=Colwellia echini TaxID=1982103 RepID=A0ABY3MXB5_9GAMM|nr:exosortase A [Colwellia echini]TYK65769.1 EpsI family protein [Colwellia echini]